MSEGASEGWTARYVRLRYDRQGQAPPAVNCFALYRMIRAERLGDRSLPSHASADTGLRQMMAFARGARKWKSVPAGEEEEGDLVLMWDVAGDGEDARAAPLHCGYVVRPEVMIDAAPVVGVSVRRFRGPQAHPAVATRVLGIYRP